MASTHDLEALLTDPHFQKLTSDILTVVAQSQQEGISANVAIDALQYVNALIYEASPYNEGPKGLRDAHKQISADAKAMLGFIRDASLKQGKPLLLAMTEQPSVN